MPTIRIYTTRWCGYCVRAKTLLDSRGLAVRGDLARRRSRVPADGVRRDRRLDRAADPRRRPSDRRLHRALAPRPRRSPRRASRRLSLTRILRLAGGTEPGRAARDLGADDRRPAAVARLVAPPVDAELVLHRASAAVGQAVVAERRPLPRETVLERRADASMQPPQLVRGRGRPRDAAGLSRARHSASST